jgi:hypothetical protein
VAGDERFLDGMGLTIRAKALDGDDVGAVELGDDGDAGGDGLVVEAPCCERGRRDACTTILPANQHGTRTAVAFGADDLGAGEIKALAEKGGEGDEGGGAADFEAAAVDVEEDVVSHDLANVRADDLE